MARDENCIFCKIAAGEAPSSKVFEDDVCGAFLDAAPIRPGHTLVVPKDHASSLAELDPETGGHLFRVGQKIATALYGGLGCDGVSVFLADGAAADRTYSTRTCTSCHASRGMGWAPPSGRTRREWHPARSWTRSRRR